MGVRDTLTTQLSSATDFATYQADRVVSPQTRQQRYDEVVAFSRARPLLASLAASTLALTLPPTLLFLLFTLATLTSCVLVGVCIALFWVSVVFWVLLVPAVVVGVGVGGLVWAWGWVAVVVVRVGYEVLMGGGSGSEVNGTKDFVTGKWMALGGGGGGGEKMEVVEGGDAKMEVPGV